MCELAPAPFHFQMTDIHSKCDTHLFVYVCNRDNPYSYLYPTQSILDSESEGKCEDKYDIGIRRDPFAPLHLPALYGAVSMKFSDYGHIG